ncbi:MAG: hypothetical protein K2X03_02425 [Bryobacteraceae bacterium]|nr:hypothetical protein [Bryobacteraceae bacterium]
MSDLKCDFCSAPHPSWRYPALTFVAYCAPDVAGESVGDWAACEICHTLIETNDHAGLAQRSLDELIVKYPEASQASRVLLESLSDLHQEFFVHRRGPAQPISVPA